MSPDRPDHRYNCANCGPEPIAWRLAFRQSLGSQELSQRGNAKDGVGGSVAAIAPPFDNLEKETFAKGRAVEREILATVIAIIERIETVLMAAPS